MHRDIIVIGASLGGLRALRGLCSSLPPDLPAAIFIVWHTSPLSPSMLPDLLRGCGPFRTAFAEDGEEITSGRIYVAPSDRHLLLAPDGVRVTQGPRENRFRPAIDPLFRSAAYAFGPRVIGIVLTGLLDDGTQGLWWIRRRGGVGIVQDPQEAEAPGMPQSAIDEGGADHVLRLAEMPPLLLRLTRKPLDSHFEQDGVGSMGRRDDENLEALHPPEASGPPTSITCPECNGAIWLLHGDQPPRYSCHVGHQYTERGMASAKGEELELALWTALRVLKENAALYGSMADRARAGGRNEASAQFDRTVEEVEAKISVIRQALATDAHAL